MIDMEGAEWGVAVDTDGATEVSSEFDSINPGTGEVSGGGPGGAADSTPPDPAPADAGWQQGLPNYVPSLRRYAGNLFRHNGSEVEDLIQETLIRGLNAGDTHPPQQCKVRQWLLSILHNTFVNHVRKNQSRLKGAAILTNSLPGDVQPAQFLRLEMADMTVAVNRLPTAQRNALLMVCVDEMSYKEVAAALNMPIGTVMSTLARARISIRATMA